jgi:hypothetical protein
MKHDILPVGNQENDTMAQKKDIRQVTLELMVLRALDVPGSLLEAETRDWGRTAASIGRFFEVRAEGLS